MTSAHPICQYYLVMNKIFLIVGAVVLVLILATGGYLFYQASQSQIPNPTKPLNQIPVPTPARPVVSPIVSVTPPAPRNQIPLTITSPIDGASVTAPTITVAGTTVPNADVSVNEKDLTADATGRFSTAIALEEGDNPILVAASDDNGNASEVELTITYNNPAVQ